MNNSVNFSMNDSMNNSKIGFKKRNKNNFFKKK